MVSLDQICNGVTVGAKQSTSMLSEIGKHTLHEFVILRKDHFQQIESFDPFKKIPSKKSTGNKLSSKINNVDKDPYKFETGNFQNIRSNKAYKKFIIQRNLVKEKVGEVNGKILETETDIETDRKKNNELKDNNEWDQKEGKLGVLDQYYNPKYFVLRAHQPLVDFTKVTSRDQQPNVDLSRLQGDIKNCQNNYCQIDHYHRIVLKHPKNRGNFGTLIRSDSFKDIKEIKSISMDKDSGREMDPKIVKDQKLDVHEQRFVKRKLFEPFLPSLVNIQSQITRETPYVSQFGIDKPSEFVSYLDYSTSNNSQTEKKNNKMKCRSQSEINDKFYYHLSETKGKIDQSQFWSSRTSLAPLKNLKKLNTASKPIIKTGRHFSNTLSRDELDLTGHRINLPLTHLALKAVNSHGTLENANFSYQDFLPNSVIKYQKSEKKFIP